MKRAVFRTFNLRTSLFGGALLLVSVLSCPAQAEELITGIRGNENAVTEFARRHGLAVFSGTTKELANTNLLYRINKTDLPRLINSSVLVLLPRTLTANEAIEGLITVHTLKTYHVERITIVVEGDAERLLVMDGDNPYTIDILSLFKAAGAEYVLDLKGKRPLEDLNFPSKVKVERNFISGNTHPSLSKDLSKILGVEEINVYDFSKMRGSRIFLVSPSPKPVNDNLVHTLSLIQMMRRAGAEVFLVTPYYPYARSDKIDSVGVTVTGRLIADLFEAAGIESIFFVRAHAAQAQGFFKVASVNISGHQTINAYAISKQINRFVGPDLGSEKDTHRHAEELKIEFGVFEKNRDPFTQVTTIGQWIGPSVEGMRTMLVDDETDTGGTLAKAAKKLNEQNPESTVAVVTHLTGTAEEVIASADLLDFAVTDTLPIDPKILKSGRVTVLSIAPEIAETLRPYLKIADSTNCVEVSTL